MTKPLSSLALLVLFTGCAAIFVPKRQKLTIVTNQPNATIYVDNEEFGSGDSATKKIKKLWTQQVVVKADGYKDKHYALSPNHRPVGYWICQVFNLPFDALIVTGIFPPMIDNMFPKNLAYDRRQVVQLDKLVKRKPEDKFIDISNISVNLKNIDKDLTTYYIKYDRDLESQIKKAENQNDLAEQKKAEKEKRKAKKRTIAAEDRKLSLDDSKFSEDIYKTLRKTGFVDTVNRIFTDNNNTLVLQGSIRKVNFYSVYNRKNKGFIYFPQRCKVFMTWYIKNTYNELLDSANVVEFSDDFVRLENNENFYVRMIGDAVQRSYLNLHKSENLQRHLAIKAETDLKQTSISVSTPKDIVTEKSNAAEASVIVKTKRGHGSGFAITNDGYVVTNYHVVSGNIPGETPKITIITSESQELNGELVAFNKSKDLALIKVEKNFARAFMLHNEKKFKNLQDIYTIGAPKSIELGQSISAGIISNERKINNNYLLQLGMSINSGNSGGPVFDAQGNLHGVIVSKLVGQNTEGIGFAIPGYLIADYLQLKYN